MKLADLKRIKLGQELTMVKHSWFPSSKLIGVKRKVTKVQSNAIGLDSSWLYFPPAKCLRGTKKGFVIDLEDSEEFREVVEYELNGKGGE